MMRTIFLPQFCRKLLKYAFNRRLNVSGFNVIFFWSSRRFKIQIHLSHKMFPKFWCVPMFVNVNWCFSSGLRLNGLCVLGSGGIHRHTVYIVIHPHAQNSQNRGWFFTGNYCRIAHVIQPEFGHELVSLHVRKPCACQIKTLSFRRQLKNYAIARICCEGCYLVHKESKTSSH